MAEVNTFRVSLVTPERAVYEGDARFLVLPAHDGELGVLRDRAPLLVALGPGTLRIEEPGGEQRFFLTGGFAQMVDNRLTVLAEHAEASSAIDLEEARAELEEARAMPSEDPDDLRAGERRREAIARAEARLKAARR